MSGSGRRTNYRKGVTKKVLYGNPEPQENEHVVRVLALRGSNLFEVRTITGQSPRPQPMARTEGSLLTLLWPLHQVQDAQGETSLTMLPTKFRKLIWVKRGDFLIVHSAASEGAETTTARGKAGAVTSIVEHILYKDQIQHLKNKDLWPEQFEAVVAKPETEQTEEEQTATSPSNASAENKTEESAAPAASSSSKNSFQMTNFDQYLNVNRNRRKGEFDDEEEEEESEDED